MHFHDIALVVEAVHTEAQEGGADNFGNDYPGGDAGSDKLVFGPGGVIDAHAGGNLGAGKGAGDPEVQQEGLELHFGPDYKGAAIQNSGVDPQAENPHDIGKEILDLSGDVAADSPYIRGAAVGKVHDNAGDHQLEEMPHD